MNTATDHQKMRGWILCTSGVLLVSSLGGQSSPMAKYWLLDHGKGEAAAGAGPRRKFLLYHPSSSSILALQMDWESTFWGYFCTCFGWFCFWFKAAEICHETKHFHNILTTFRSRFQPLYNQNQHLLKPQLLQSFPLAPQHSRCVHS